MSTPSEVVSNFLVPASYNSAEPLPTALIILLPDESSKRMSSPLSFNAPVPVSSSML
jgi:hypothetical protein